MINLIAKKIDVSCGISRVINRSDYVIIDYYKNKPVGDAETATLYLLTMIIKYPKYENIVRSIVHNLYDLSLSNEIMFNLIEKSIVIIDKCENNFAIYDILDVFFSNASKFLKVLSLSEFLELFEFYNSRIHTDEWMIAPWKGLVTCMSNMKSLQEMLGLIEKVTDEHCMGIGSILKMSIELCGEAKTKEVVNDYFGNWNKR